MKATRAPAPIDPELACPIAPVVDIVFSRWTTPILWSLNEYGRQRFGELERRITTITPKVMTQRLRQLERDGLIVRTYHPEIPPRVEYEITAEARRLRPVFEAIFAWASESTRLEPAQGIDMKPCESERLFQQHLSFWTLWSRMTASAHDLTAACLHE